MPLWDYTWDQFKIDMKNYAVNDGPKAIFVLLYILANIAVFLERFLHYYYNEPDAFDLLGHGVTFARGAAAALKLNCAFVLLPILRNFLSWLRGTWVNNYIPIDKNIVFHRKVAWAIVFWTCVHAEAHYVNYHSISTADPKDLSILNINSSQAPSSTALAWTTIPGATGHVVVLCMILMYSSAIDTVRRPYFEIFWYTHHLFIVFFGLLCFHGTSALLEGPNFWLWCAVPGLLCVGERLVRIFRGSQTTVLQLARQHPSSVIELRMKKTTFDYIPGQYLFLNCPYISSHEWHPFTITSAPDEDFVSVHIRMAGDWTKALGKLFNPEGKKSGIVQQDVVYAVSGQPILRIDGPFGAASEEVFNYEVVMLIGAGIGVTPFASILKHCRYTIERQMKGDRFLSTQLSSPISKVYFYWICRDRNAFEWFQELLAVLERENINNFLEINAYLTGMRPTEVRAAIKDQGEAEIDKITGLQAPTLFGRPKWDEIFQEKAKLHPNKNVGVFFCGPKPLSKSLYQACRKHTSVLEGGTRFFYHKENF